jgi:hypothetical protein
MNRERQALIASPAPKGTDGSKNNVTGGNTPNGSKGPVTQGGNTKDGSKNNVTGGGKSK